MSVSYPPLLRILLSVLLAAIMATATGGRVTEVYDGRSFALEDGARVRLLGVSVPRVYESGGDIALEVLAKFVRGRTVRLEADGPDTDADGWLLRYV
ncbi:MAG TPA: hypothetical protein ENN51_02735, partial [candidate division WOR-3 bacterium]|nr:hypothetical protein [candidate division WOR-3 bacterium]